MTRTATDVVTTDIGQPTVIQHAHATYRNDSAVVDSTAGSLMMLN